MQAQRLILETDQAGNLKQIPKLPPNKQIEGIFLVLSDIPEKSPPKNAPHPDLAGKVQIMTEIFESVPDTDWEKL
jgi:hypothetical protein